MRYKADNIITRCYSLPLTVPKKHETMRVGNVHFIWRRFLAHYSTLWMEYLFPLNISSGDFVFVQTGAWDLNENELEYILGRGFALFIERLAYIRDRLIERGANLIIVTLPPYSYISRNGDRGGRNNFSVAAFNALITSAAVRLGLRVHDEFGLILPRCEEFVCYSHYLCRIPEENKMQGAAGLVSSNMMLKSVCRSGV